jgi:hypothetical protein
VNESLSAPFKKLDKENRKNQEKHMDNYALDWVFVNWCLFYLHRILQPK